MDRRTGSAQPATSVVRRILIPPCLPPLPRARRSFLILPRARRGGRGREALKYETEHAKIYGYCNTVGIDRVVAFGEFVEAQLTQLNSTLSTHTRYVPLRQPSVCRMVCRVFVCGSCASRCVRLRVPRLSACPPSRRLQHTHTERSKSYAKHRKHSGLSATRFRLTRGNMLKSR